MFSKLIKEAREEISHDEIEAGTDHEMEHTSDRDMARRIAMDHLRENPHYYSELEKCGID